MADIHRYYSDHASRAQALARALGGSLAPEVYGVAYFERTIEALFTKVFLEAREPLRTLPLFAARVAAVFEDKDAKWKWKDALDADYLVRRLASVPLFSPSPACRFSTRTPGASSSASSTRPATRRWQVRWGGASFAACLKEGGRRPGSRCCS